MKRRRVLVQLIAASFILMLKSLLKCTRLADMLVARPPQLHVGCAPALSDTRWTPRI